MLKTSPRRGFSLVELLIALTVLGVVGGALTTAIVRQQRITARSAAQIDVRNQGRITVGTLASELRGISSIGGDIAAMGDRTITFRATVGTSVVCAISGARTTVDIPTERQLTGGHLLTSFLDPTSAQPLTTTDTAWVLNPTLAIANPWDSVRVTSIATNASGACPSGAGTLVPAADDTRDDYRVTFDRALPAGVAVGSSVRFTRLVRYTFRQNTGVGGDDRWYLYYQTCTPACGDEQLMSGPFQPGTADPATTGFLFQYFDAAGAATAVRANVARIDITARPVSRENVSRTGGSTRQALTQDEVVSIAVRNRS